MFRDKSNKDFLVKSCLFAYGLPFTIVTLNISTTVGYLDTLTKNTSTCDGGKIEAVKSATAISKNIYFSNEENISVSAKLVQSIRATGGTLQQVALLGVSNLFSPHRATIH